MQTRRTLVGASPAIFLCVVLVAPDGRAQSSYAGTDFVSMSSGAAGFRLSEATLRAFGSPQAAPAAAETNKEDEWRFSVTPLLWCASVDAKINIGSVSSSASPSFSDIASQLDYGAMGQLEFGKGKWSLFSDLAWLDIGDENNSGPIGAASVDVRFQEFLGSLNLGYRVLDLPLDNGRADGPRLLLDTYAGVRYSRMNGELNFKRRPTESDTVDWWDPLIGLRARLAVTPKLSFQTRWDFGGWGVGTEHTWYLSGGVFWRAFESLTIGGGYAALYQDYYGANFHLTETLQGPFVSLTFDF